MNCPEYKQKVIDGLKLWKNKSAAQVNATAHHINLAQIWDGQLINGDRVTALPDRVEFTCGSQCTIVKYDISPEEWESQIKRWFNGNT